MSEEGLSSIIKEMAKKRVKSGEVDEPSVERPKKLNLKAAWREVSRKQKGLLMAMFGLLLLSLVLLIISLITIRPQSTVVIVGYGDVYGEVAGLTGGYRRDSWLNMLAFPILAVVFGFLHNVIALRIYRKYGKDTALMFVYVSMLLVVGAIVVLLRLLGEW